MGAPLGLCFGLVSQWGDKLTVPGIPLHKPAFGPAGNMVMYTAGAALLGMLVALPLSGIKGTAMVAAGSAAVIITSLRTAEQAGNNPTRRGRAPQ